MQLLWFGAIIAAGSGPGKNIDAELEKLIKETENFLRNPPAGRIRNLQQKQKSSMNVPCVTNSGQQQLLQQLQQVQQQQVQVQLPQVQQQTVDQHRVEYRDLHFDNFVFDGEKIRPCRSEECEQFRQRAIMMARLEASSDHGPVNTTDTTSNVSSTTSSSSKSSQRGSLQSKLQSWKKQSKQQVGLHSKKSSSSAGLQSWKNTAKSSSSHGNSSTSSIQSWKSSSNHFKREHKGYNQCLKKNEVKTAVSGATQSQMAEWSKMVLAGVRQLIEQHVKRIEIEKKKSESSIKKNFTKNWNEWHRRMHKVNSARSRLKSQQHSLKSKTSSWSRMSNSNSTTTQEQQDLKAQRLKLQVEQKKLDEAQIKLKQEEMILRETKEKLMQEENRFKRAQQVAKQQTEKREHERSQRIKQLELQISAMNSRMIDLKRKLELENRFVGLQSESCQQSAKLMQSEPKASMVQQQATVSQKPQASSSSQSQFESNMNASSDARNRQTQIQQQQIQQLKQRLHQEQLQHQQKLQWFHQLQQSQKYWSQQHQDDFNGFASDLNQKMSSLSRTLVSSTPQTQPKTAQDRADLNSLRSKLQSSNRGDLLGELRSKLLSRLYSAETHGEDANETQGSGLTRRYRRIVRHKAVGLHGLTIQRRTIPDLV